MYVRRKSGVPVGFDIMSSRLGFGTESPFRGRREQGAFPPRVKVTGTDLGCEVSRESRPTPRGGDELWVMRL